MEYVKVVARKIQPDTENLVKVLKELHLKLLRTKTGLKRYNLELGYKMWKPDTKFSEWMNLYKPRVRESKGIVEFAVNASLWEYLAFDIKSMVKKYGYYTANEKIDVSYKVYTFYPNYGKRVQVGAKVYHWTLSENVGAILRKGLTPRADKKLEDYPPRVYLVKTIADAEKLKPAFLSFGQDVEDAYRGAYNDLSLLEIDVSKFKANYYDDVNSNGVWTYSWIPPQAIKVFK